MNDFAIQAGQMRNFPGGDHHSSVAESRLINTVSEPVASIDYSLGAIFSAQDRRFRHISNSKQDEIDRIFRRLSKLQTSQSSEDLASDKCSNGFASWYGNNMTLMERYRAGM